MKLDEICAINMGQSPDSSTYNETGEGLPFYQGNADFGEIHPTVRVWCSVPVKTALAGDILISVRAPIGAMNVADADCCIGRGLAALTVDEEKCVGEYLWYALSSCVNGLISKGTGSTFKAISKGILQETEIPCPGIPEQRQIAETLKRVDALIAIRKQQFAKLDELVKARFVEIFGDPVSNTFGWKQSFLYEVTSKIGSGATPRGGKESYHADGTTLIRSMNVHDGRFEYKDLAHITDEQAAQLDNVTVEELDVFINITGASVARSCIVPSEVLPARVNQHVAIIRCIRSRLHPTFANNMFLNDRFKGVLLDIGESGGATRQAITKQQLEMLRVILPPVELQEQFVSFAEQTDKSKTEIKRSLETLERLKKALMQKYFG